MPDSASPPPRALRRPPALMQLEGRTLRAAAAAGGLLHHLRTRRRYRSLPGAEALRWRDEYPQLTDRTPTSPFDPHYFYQDVWAAKHVARVRPQRHVDVGSRVDYVGFLTAICAVTFVDIRPLEAQVEGLESITGNVTEMPFSTESVESLSCLHVAEHIGLGRYGDPLDPAGTRRAAAELQRVLAPGGQLLFSLPIGTPRVCFNAHRIHAPHEILEMFGDLELSEFCGVDDHGSFHERIEPNAFADARYACGMFRFTRRS